MNFVAVQLTLFFKHASQLDVGDSGHGERRGGGDVDRARGLVLEHIGAAADLAERDALGRDLGGWVPFLRAASNKL